MGRAYGLLLGITSSWGLREWPLVYLFSLLIIILLLPLYLYYSSVCPDPPLSQALGGCCATGANWQMV